MAFGKILEAELAGNTEIRVGNSNGVLGLYAGYVDLGLMSADAVVKLTSYKQIENADGDDNFKPASSITLDFASLKEALYYPPPLAVANDRSFELGVQLVSGTPFDVQWEIIRQYLLMEQVVLQHLLIFHAVASQSLENISWKKSGH